MPEMCKHILLYSTEHIGPNPVTQSYGYLYMYLCITRFVLNVLPLREWYHASAVLLLPSFTQRILSALYDLSDVTFHLPLEGVELDEHWPSFAL